jgi:hypothetical protein
MSLPDTQKISPAYKCFYYIQRLIKVTSLYYTIQGDYLQRLPHTIQPVLQERHMLHIKLAPCTFRLIA